MDVFHGISNKFHVTYMYTHVFAHTHTHTHTHTDGSSHMSVPTYVKKLSTYMKFTESTDAKHAKYAMHKLM
jgi:hypothetical protein